MLGLGGAFLALIVIAVAAGSSGQRPSASSANAASVEGGARPAAAQQPITQTVTYVVDGSAADVTYGPTGTSLSGTVPMRFTEPLGSPDYYSIDAQLDGDGVVTCKIEVDGKIISQSTASGDYNIASCEISQGLLGSWEDDNG